MRFLTFILIVFTSSSLFAQKWTYASGNKSDIAYKVITDTDGDIIVVGQMMEDKTLRGALLILNEIGEVTQGSPFFYGNSKKAIFKSVTQKYDGSFLLVGEDINPSSGSLDGWVLNVKKDGTIISEHFFGEDGKDGFNDVIQHSSGDVAIVGYNEVEGKHNAWFVTLNKDNKRFVDKNYGGKKSTFNKGNKKIFRDEFRAIVETADGNYAVAGITDKIWSTITRLTKLDAQTGEAIWTQTYNDKISGECWDLITTNDGQLATVGYRNKERGGTWEAWYIKAQQTDGQLFQQDTLNGGREQYNDVFYGIIQKENGSIQTIGNTKSYIRGGLNNNIMIAEIPEENTLIENQSDSLDFFNKNTELFGTNEREEEGRSIVQLSNGDLVIVGKSEAKADMGFLVMCLKETNSRSSKKVELNIQSFKVIDQNGDNAFGNNETGFIIIDIINNSNIPAYEVKASVDSEQKLDGLFFQENINIGLIPPKSKRSISIPIWTTKEMPSEKLVFDVNFSDYNNSDIRDFSFFVDTKAPEQPLYELVDCSFKAEEGDVISKSRAAYFKGKLTNTGNIAGKNVTLAIQLPNGISLLSGELDYQIENLDIGEQVPFELKFYVDKDFEYEKLKFTCNVTENNAKGSGIKKIFETTVDDRPEVIRDDITIAWRSPEPYTYKAYTLKVDFLNITLDIGSNKELDKKNMYVLVNGQRLPEFSKSGERQIISSLNTINKKMTYRFEKRLDVFNKEGYYTIELVVENEKGEQFTSSELEIHYTPNKPNLHILAIAPTYDNNLFVGDLQYIEDDAIKFAETFENQGGEGKLFGAVKIKKLIGKDATRRNIVTEILKLSNNSGGYSINENDVIIVYISSHGIMKDEFRILPTDFENVELSLLDEYTVSFKKNILTPLNDTKSKRILLVDACHSGSANDPEVLNLSKNAVDDDDKLSSELVKLMNADNGFLTIASCRPKEKSWEDPALKQGVFTAAILEALNNEERMVLNEEQNTEYKYQSSEDDIIDINELFKYVELRVPYLIQKNVKPLAEKDPRIRIEEIKQHPCLSKHDNTLDINIPIYIND